jgi:hypothetical protein
MEVSGQLHASASLLPKKEPTDTHWIGDLVDPRAGMDTGIEKNLLPLPGIEPRLSNL